MILHLDNCAYCGGTVECIDHVLPVSDWKNKGLAHLRFGISSCNRCNSTANSKVFQSFEAKAGYLLQRAIKRGIVQWEPLLKTVPIVQNFLNKNVNGKNTVLPNVENSPLDEPNERRCAYCGTALMGSHGNRKFCGYRCYEYARFEADESLVQRSITDRNNL